MEVEIFGITQFDTSGSISFKFYFSSNWFLLCTNCRINVPCHACHPHQEYVVGEYAGGKED